MSDKISAILLSGGTGQRMNSASPKQYLMLAGKPLIFHSLEILQKIPDIFEIIVVCEPQYQNLFENFNVRFALPGNRRQDSLENGLKSVSEDSKWICVHDAARPFITEEMVLELILEGKKVGAATLGMPLKFTVKESSSSSTVIKTIDRSTLWEIQTPQFISREVLLEGFAFANKHQLTVTDDVSLAELINRPVKLVKGSYKNIKITTPEDLVLAHAQV